MSTSVDSRRRPSLWSYISFGSNPRRRQSVSLPTNHNGDHDPFEKANRHSRSNHKSTLSAVNAAWMNQTPRAKFFRLGGILIFLAFLFFLLSPGERAKVGQFVESKSAGSRPAQPH
jgi:guanosine-diphosphatase